MSNNMIDDNQRLFQPILQKIDDLAESEDRKINYHNKHCVVFSGGEEKSFFLELKEEKKHQLLHQIKCVLLEMNGEYYFVVNDDSVDIYTLEYTSGENIIELCNDYSSAIFLFLSSRGIIEFDDSKVLEIYDKFLYNDPEQTEFDYFQNGTRKHTFESIKPFFENFIIFKIVDIDLFKNIDKKLDIFKILSFMMIHDNDIRRLPFKKNTLNKFYEIATSQNQYIPYEFITESLISTKWKHIYKDLYRCIEALYAYPKVSNLIENNDCCKCENIEKIIASIENELGWRPTEQEALQSLLKLSSNDLLGRFIDLFNVNDPNWKPLEESISTRENEISRGGIEPAEIESKMHEIERYQQDVRYKKADYIGKKLYKLRNSLVHFRKALGQANQFNDEEWNRLTVYMLDLISEVYDKFHERS